MIAASDLKAGMTFEQDGKLIKVMEASHHKPGKGNTVMRMKLKDVRTGSTTDTTMRPDEKVKKAHIDTKPVQYLYSQDDMAIFMDLETYEQYLDELKETVLPFKEPSTPQVTKAFRKVKKLKIPEWENMDLRNNTYVGWNDAGTQKKFILAYRENKLIGVHGTLSPTIVKGVCSICQTITNVSMFLATTKSGGDGTYTKKGNYICHDSDTCNQQLTQPEYLEAFMENVKAVK